MSLSKTSLGLARLVIALTFAFALSGCIRPLYGTSAAGDSVRRSLSSIDVKPIPDVAGHYLREELLFNLTGGSTSDDQPSKYSLTITITESTQAVAIDSTGGRSDAASVTLSVKYVLADLSGKTVNEGTSVASGSIDRLSQRFAAVRAVREAKIRIAKTLADQIEAQLAAYFVGQSK